MDNSLHPWASVVVERQGGCSHQAEQLSSLLLPSCSLLRYLSGGKVRFVSIFALIMRNRFLLISDAWGIPA